MGAGLRAVKEAFIHQRQQRQRQQVSESVLESVTNRPAGLRASRDVATRLSASALSLQEYALFLKEEPALPF